MISTDEASLLALNALIRAARDSERGYLAAGDLVAEPDLVQLFAENALQRTKFAQELEARVRTLRSTPEKTSGTIAGEMHRGWMGLNAALATNETHAILAECERGEDMAVVAYRDALKQPDLDVQTRELIQRQYELVQAAHDRVRQLRDRAAAVR
jgi:uncharacterized protein (TIGR02284 family)